MRVFRGLREAEGKIAASAVTIGNFDGVHIGHQAIFRRLCAAAVKLRVKPTVITFDPHPSRVIDPSRAPGLLSTLELRLTWMRECGIAQVLVIPFDANFMKVSPEDFVTQILVGGAKAQVVLIGENFRFGHKHAGDTELLKKLGSKYGFSVNALKGVVRRGAIVSSTEIRRRVIEGDVDGAKLMLGRPYALQGEHVEGHGIGSKQTVPTLNLKTACEVLPGRGVYVTRVVDLNKKREWPSVTNVGVRPTFDGDELAIESFVLGEFREPAPKQMRVEFFKLLRLEKKFPSPEALKSQILRDAERARRYWI